MIEKWNGKPDPASWLMIRRSLTTGEKEVKFYLSNAPETISLAEMAWAGCQRWSIEVDFNLAKREVGLDHYYELTKYRGWHHHTAMVLLAMLFLLRLKRKLAPNAHLKRFSRDFEDRHAKKRSFPRRTSGLQS